VIPVLDRQLVFVTGKGGVGKTTVATALGLAAAARGRRTVICEVGSQRRVPPLFGLEPPDGGQEVEVAPGLAATSIEPNALLRHWLEVQLRSRSLAALLARTPVFVLLVAAIPGRRQADRVRSLLTDARRTAYVAVALPEEMPVTETLELERELRDEVGVGPTVVVANGMLTPRFSAAELGRLEAEPPDGWTPELGAALAAARSHGRRARTQQAQLRRLRRGAYAPVVTLPELLDSDIGPRSLERLARELRRRLA
jgi:anion-transporting  ArsA/GET3 family ATPase